MHTLQGRQTGGIQNLMIRRSFWKTLSQLKVSCSQRVSQLRFLLGTSCCFTCACVYAVGACSCDLLCSKACLYQLPYINAFIVENIMGALNALCMAACGTMHKAGIAMSCSDAHSMPHARGSACWPAKEVLKVIVLMRNIWVHQ